MELPDHLSINDVTRHAFGKLGESGVIQSAENHFCNECTHKYKRTADLITPDDPAAIVGIDENRAVPAMTGENADLAVCDAAQARLNAQNAMDVDHNSQESSENGSALESPVKMVVLDGIVMGPTVS